MKSLADSKHRELHFSKGDWVWLRLHQRQIPSLAPGLNIKLCPCFFGPYKVISKVGSVAYHLEMPEQSGVHNVFHVSTLKPFHGIPPGHVSILPPLHHEQVQLQLANVLRARLNRGVWELLVQWKMDSMNEPVETWMKSDFHKEFSDYQLADELFQTEGGSAMDSFVGIQYKHRNQIAHSKFLNIEG